MSKFWMVVWITMGFFIGELLAWPIRWYLTRRWGAVCGYKEMMRRSMSAGERLNRVEEAIRRIEGRR